MQNSARYLFCGWVVWSLRNTDNNVRYLTHYMWVSLQKLPVVWLFHFYLNMIPLHITKERESGIFNQENKMYCFLGYRSWFNELSFFIKAATADASKVDRGSKKGLKNGGIAAMFAAQTSQIKQQDGMDKKVWWIIFLFVWRDIDILPFKPLLFIIQCYLICRLMHSEGIVNKGLKGIKSVIIKSCAGLKLAVVFPRGGSEEKSKCLWFPVFFMI